MDIYNQIAIRIIKEQELVIGPLAWIEASKVHGLKIHEQGVVDIEQEDKGVVIDGLVAKYQRLFGKASHEVCKHAVAGLLSGLTADQIPSSLR